MIDMVTKRIAIRTDANSEIGTGHFMRCLTLADELKKKNAFVCFVTRGLPAYLSQMLHDRNIEYFPLPEVASFDAIEDLAHSKWLKVSQQQDAIQALELLANHSFDWLVVDHYALDHRWESMLRSISKKILVIDDLADRRHDCDALLDQNYYHDMNNRYDNRVSPDCMLLLGPEYALLRQEFLLARKSLMARSGVIKRVMVFFGGVDATNMTRLVLHVLKSMNLSINVDVVLGMQHPDLDGIKKLCALNNFNCHVQTTEMAKLMNEADLAITAGGSVNWEKCCLGLPSIVIATAQNQVKLSEELGALNVCHYLGQIQNISESDIHNSIDDFLLKQEKINRFSVNGMQLVDGFGAIKVVKAMEF